MGFLDYAMIAYIIANVVLIPHTKIEEIFQVNNIYDHLYLGSNIKDYDFIIFDGVVYRTFLSSLMIAIINFPIKFLIQALGLTSYSMLIISRITLGLLNFYALKVLQRVIAAKFDKLTANCFFVLFLVQFHSLFYFSRPLPNSFALIFCNLAFAHWLDGKWGRAIGYLAFATIVFRQEVFILAFSMLVFDFLRGRIWLSFQKDDPRQKTLIEIIKWGAISSIISLAVSIPIDTYFWGLQYDIRYRNGSDKLFLMWPELHSFYFNGVQNKSSEWGVSPWYWYFLVAIPKSVTCAVPFLLIGLLYQRRDQVLGIFDRKIVEVMGPVMIFVGIFSVLPHKELRFIMPSLTLINIAGAYGLSKMMNVLSKSALVNRLLVLLAVGLLGGSLAFSFISNVASMYNYPGGDAIKFFNQDYLNEMRLNSKLPAPYIHSDVYTTMTGFTRFLHEHDQWSGSQLGWRYNKTENMPDSEYSVYTHLVTDRTNYTGFVPYKQPFKQFSRINIFGFLKNPFKNPLVILEDRVYLLEREDINRIRVSQVE